MIYEFRIYEPHDGQAARLRQRFERHALPLLARHRVEVVAVFKPEPDDGRLCYLTRFADEAMRLAAWAAFQADVEWRTIKAASERDGALLRNQSVTLMTSISVGLPAL